MITIDTNVLLRYLLEDDAEQLQKAVKLIAGKRKVLITDVVLVETIWTLRGKKYQLDKAALVALMPPRPKGRGFLITPMRQSKRRDAPVRPEGANPTAWIDRQSAIPQRY